MKATAIIHLPPDVCEVSTAAKLRQIKGIYSAYMTRAQQVVIKYNGKKYTTQDLFKQAKAAKVARSFAHIEHPEDPEELETIEEGEGWEEPGEALPDYEPFEFIENLED